jgi:hypothetical protein
MAYTGGIRFMDLPSYYTKMSLHIDFDIEREEALVASVGWLRNCTIEPVVGDKKYHIIMDLSRAKIGWIKYDVEAIQEFQRIWCLLIGKMKQGRHIWSESHSQYYLLVIRPTSMEYEYERIGYGTVQRKYVLGYGRRVWIV